ILPTRRGYAVIATLILMLLTSLNYALSLGLGVTFLLGGLVAAALLHAHRNLREQRREHRRRRSGRAADHHAGGAGRGARPPGARARDARLAIPARSVARVGVRAFSADRHRLSGAGIIGAAVAVGRTRRRRPRARSR